MHLYFMIIGLVAATWLSYFAFDHDAVSPGFLFCIGFLIAGFDLLLMCQFWNLAIKAQTVALVLSGVFSYLIGVQVARAGDSSKAKNRRRSAPSVIKISDAMYLLCALISLACVLLTFTYITGTGGLSELSSSIGAYHELERESGRAMPAALSLLYDLTFLSGYVWAYVIACNYSIVGRIEIRPLLLLACSVMVALLTSRRGDAVALIFAMAVLLLFFNREALAIRASRKAYAIVFVSVLIVVLAFQGLGVLLGRDSGLYGSFEYFSIYLGGPLANFDQITSLSYSNDNELWGSETFYSFYNGVGSNLGISDWIYPSDRFFTSHNGHRTGNVYTAFFDYYHDFGSLGVVVVSLVTGYFSQRFYGLCVEERKENAINFFVLLWAYVSFLIARSFFANSMFAIFTPSFVKVVCLLALIVAIVQSGVGEVVRKRP